MILEIATFDIVPGREEGFEEAFAVAQEIIISMPGYLSHQLQRCIENSSRYVLLVKWETLEAHTDGFRNSPEYQEWKKLLHHFFKPFPAVEHFNLVY